MRRILSSDSPDRRLEEVLAAQRHEIEEQAARLEDAVRDLERREQLLRDSRASLERLLRLGTSDLESRESELVQLMRDLTAREEHLQEAEAELARRREELGAVELKRAAVERRERAVLEREEEIAALETAPGAGAATNGEVSTDPSPLLLFVPGAGYRLREIEHVPVATGARVVLDGEEFVISRTGRSPLPGDPRRCAYLDRAPRAVSSGGSS